RQSRRKAASRARRAACRSRRSRGARRRGRASELPQDAQVAFPEGADVGDVVAELGGALESTAEREAAPLLRVEADVLEDARVDHAGAAHLDPAGELARAAAGSPADPARDVGLDRRLGEGEEVRAEADAPLRAVKGAHHVEERPLQVRERKTAVDGEPLELVEDRIAGGGDRVAAVDTADRDHVDRRLLLLHLVDLRRARLRPEDALFVEEERVARRAGRVRRPERELVEVVLDGLDLPVVANLPAEAEERVLD